MFLVGYHVHYYLEKLLKSHIDLYTYKYYILFPPDLGELV